MEIGSAPAIDMQELHRDTARDLGSLPAPAYSSDCGVGSLRDMDEVDTADSTAASMQICDVPEADVQTGRNDESREIDIPAAEDVSGFGRTSRLFPNSIQTTDLKHIVDNLLHECLNSMSLRLGCHSAGHIALSTSVPGCFRSAINSAS